MLLIIISIVTNISGCCWRYSLLDQPCEVFGLVGWCVVVVVVVIHDLIINIVNIIAIVANSLPPRPPAIHLWLYSLVTIIDNRLDRFDRLTVVALLTQPVLPLYLLYCFLLAAKRVLLLFMLIILLLLMLWWLIMLMILSIIGLFF